MKSMTLAAKRNPKTRLKARIILLTTLSQAGKTEPHNPLLISIRIVPDQPLSCWSLGFHKLDPIGLLVESYTVMFIIAPTPLNFPRITTSILALFIGGCGGGGSIDSAAPQSKTGAKTAGVFHAIGERFDFGPVLAGGQTLEHEFLLGSVDIQARSTMIDANCQNAK